MKFLLVAIVIASIAPAIRTCEDVQDWCEAGGVVKGSQYCTGAYEDWAENNCKKSCDLCTKVCANQNDDSYCEGVIASYTFATICEPEGQYYWWGEQNCNAACKLCTPGDTAAPTTKTTTTTTTTVAPTTTEACTNLKDDSYCEGVIASYTFATICEQGGRYYGWGKKNCYAACKHCDSGDTAATTTTTTTTTTVAQTAAPAEDTQAWCDLYSGNSMCKYSGPGNACTGIYAHGSLKSADKTAVLNVHNTLRKKISDGEENGMPKPATPLPDLEWDDELAQLAQRWIEQCIWEHDSGKTSKFDYVGQNLYQRSTSWKEDAAAGDVWDRAVNSWYDEVGDYVNAGMTPTKFVQQSGIMIGHFTQVIWADTTHVGCGYVRFKQGSMYKVFVGCNYGPGGNWLNQPIYTPA